MFMMFDLVNVFYFDVLFNLCGGVVCVVDVWLVVVVDVFEWCDDVVVLFFVVVVVLVEVGWLLVVWFVG